MVVLCLFCLELLVCVALGWPIVAALLVGLVLFVGWALRQGYGLRAVGSGRASGRPKMSSSSFCSSACSRRSGARAARCRC